MSIPFLSDLVDLLRRLAAPADVLPFVVDAGLTIKNMREGKYDGLVSATESFALAFRRMGFAAFRARWAFVRQLMSLQSRLFLEQILWAMGPPWRTLLTGFNPIELGGVGILVPFREDPEEESPNVIEGTPGGGPGLLPLPPGSGGGAPPPGGGPGVVITSARRRRARWKRRWRRR